MAKKDEERITDKLGEILKRERAEAGYTREEIAERAGIGVRHLAAIENERRMPSAEVMCRLIRAIGISATPEPGDSRETAHLIRLIRICGKKACRAVKAMFEVLCYSSVSEDHE